MAYFVGPEEGHNSVRLDGEVHVLRNETTGHSRRYCIHCMRYYANDVAELVKNRAAAVSRLYWSRDLQCPRIVAQSGGSRDIPHGEISGAR